MQVVGDHDGAGLLPEVLGRSRTDRSVQLQQLRVTTALRSERVKVIDPASLCALYRARI
jgi:hypothetical protein